MRKLCIIGLLVFAGWLLPGTALAQFTETKEIRKEFGVTPETQIEITNKYGKIDIKTWEKDSVLFLINLRVEEKKLSKLEDAVRGIDFDITSNDHYVIVRTNVGKNKSSLGKELSRFKESLLKSDGSVQVDYTVWLPGTNALKIENKFGDIYVDDYPGEIEINLSNGNLKAHDFEGETNLIMNFADANINTLKSAQIDCNFSEMYIKNAEDLKIISKSSDFEFNTANAINIESRRDKYRFREVELLKAKSSFTSYRIDELSDRLNVRAEYGSLELEEVVSDFSNITIESKSTDIDLYFKEESNFAFDLTLTNLDYDLCKEMSVEEEEALDEKGNKKRLTGVFGKNDANGTKLNITADSGKLNIRLE